LSVSIGNIGQFSPRKGVALTFDTYLLNISMTHMPKENRRIILKK